MKLMKKLFVNVFLLSGIAAATLLLGGNAQAMLIDDFNGNYGEVTGEANLSQPYFNAWGGIRTLQIFGSANDRLSVELETGSGINGILWHENGDDRGNDSLVRWGSGEPDLTDGGSSDRFAIEFLSVRSDDQFNLRVAGGVNDRSVDFTVDGPGTKTILFSDIGLSPSDFELVSLVELNITGTRRSSIQIDSIQTTGPTGPVPPVTIGGTVTGLEGSGLVLQNNGADDEPIAADGEFTFDTLLTPGTSYSVTVKTQPSGQFCTVDKGSGTVPAEGVDDVLVTCGDLPLLDKIIGSWSSGIWCWDFVAATWTQLSIDTTKGDLSAADFTGDGIADVAAIFEISPVSNPSGPGIYYLDGASKTWTFIPDSAPPAFNITAGDLNGDGRPEIIGAWSVGIWYYDFVAATWTQLSTDTTDKGIAAGNFFRNDIADVAAIFEISPVSNPSGDGLYYFLIDVSVGFYKIPESAPAPFSLTAGNVIGD